MSILTENIPTSSALKTTSCPVSDDEDHVAYYSDDSTQSSDTFHHDDYVAAVDPLENPHKRIYEDNIGCIVHVQTDDELDDDTSADDFDSLHEQLEPSFTPASPSPVSNSKDDSDTSSIYSNESEYADNESFHLGSFGTAISTQQHHSLEIASPSSTSSSLSSSSSASDYSRDKLFDGNTFNRSQSANTEASTPPPVLEDESNLEHKLVQCVAKPRHIGSCTDEDYSLADLDKIESSASRQEANLSTANRSTLRLSTVSVSELNEISLLEDTRSTDIHDPIDTNSKISVSATDSSISNEPIDQVPDIVKPMKYPAPSSVSTALSVLPSLSLSSSASPPPLPAKDRTIKPSPIDTTATTAMAAASNTAMTTPTMTPSLSSTTQRFVSGLWSPFKATPSAKKVVRPSANFTERQKRQSRPPSCALPGFQESLLAQMEQLNSDNGNDPKAQQLLNLKRQTIRQSLVIASFALPDKDDYDWEFWSSVICDFEQVHKSKELSIQVQKGIPPTLRGMVWQLLTKSKQLELTEEQQYIDLLRTSSPYDKMIQRDLARTFPGHDYFKQQDGVGQEGLYNVVRAYSVYDTEVGYCQGLAFIVGPLLLNMPDEEAFCVLIRLMSTYGLRGHFTPNMEGLHLRLYQFESLLAEHLPHISRHLQRRGIDSTMYASQWFMTLFAYKFPLDLVFRIYDMVFAEGLCAVFKFAFTLLKRNETHILQLDFEHLLDFLKNGLFEEYRNDERQLMQDISEWEIPRRRLLQLEKEHKAQVTKEEQDARLLESLQKQQATLQKQVDQLQQSSATLQKEQQDVRDQLQDSQHQRQQMTDEQVSLQMVVASLKTEMEAIPPQVENKYKTEFDQLCKENAHLNQKNALVEDQLSAMESLLIDIKMRYAQSENERDELSKRLFELKKVIGQ